MDKKYCIYCGTENDVRAKFCVKCGKEMEPKENLLINFLIKRTKDKFKGTAEDSLYEALKNFLLSHLYGVALTVSFVSAIAVTGYASQPHISEMSNADIEKHIAAKDYSEVVTPSVPVTPGGVYSAEYNSAVHNLITSYEFEVLNAELIDSQGNTVTTDPDKYRLPASYGYGGIHELNTSLPAYIENTVQNGVKNRTEFDPAFFQRDISHNLYADGYTVGECEVETYFEDSNGQTVASYEYILVAVLVNDEWLVAEDKIIEVYEAGPQPVNYDIDTVAALEAASDYYEAVLKGNDGSYLLADNLLGHSVQHQLSYDETMPYGEQGTDTETVYTELIQTYEFANNISAVLRNEGYTVVEYLFEQTVYDTNNSYRVIGARDFCMTMVEIDGSWYVAEDVVIYSTQY